MEITIRMPDDMHLHLRQGRTLKQVLPWTANQFARAVVMPNTIPPITTARLLEDYRNEIKQAGPDFEPLMVFKIMADMDSARIRELKKAGAAAGKLYPRGSTTNAQDGPSEISKLYPVFTAMQENGLILCIHAEDPKIAVLEREQAFLPVIGEIAENFPGLKIIVEHVSTKEAVEFVKNSGENISATVTLHHLLFTLDDLIGGKLDADLFCKPVIKQEADRESIRQAVFSGNSKFFFGSDSAPHSKTKKLEEGSAGIFSAPVIMPMLALLFEENKKLNLLDNFVSGFGADFYGLQKNKKLLILEKQISEVPEKVGEIVPVFAGKVLDWRVRKE